MPWQYRVIVENIEGNPRWAIHEYYYDCKLPGLDGTYASPPSMVETWDEDDPDYGSPIEQLRWQLNAMLQALDREVLDMRKTDQ